MQALSSLADLVRVHGRNRPDHPAFVIDGSVTSYADLDRLSSRVAEALRAEGVGSGQRVAFLDKNTLEYFALLFGAAKLDAVTVAVNWRLAAAEMRFIVEHAETRVLVVGEEFLDHVREMDLPPAIRVVVVGSGEGRSDADIAGSVRFEDWIAGYAGEDPLVGSTADATCYQLYTSGTTGLPKGVELTQRNVMTALRLWAEPWMFDENSRSAVVMPLFHVAGSLWALAGLHAGATNVMLRAVDPGAVLRTIRDQEITNILLVPAVMQALLATPGLDDVDFSAIRTVVYGASPITEAVQREFMLRATPRLTQVYGLTETTGGATLLTPADHARGGDLLRAAGRPGPGVALRIVDTETGADLGDGEVGEVWIRTAQNLKGYWKDTAATAAVYPEGYGQDDGGWFRSGDAGYLRGGVLFLHDRVKDMIVSGGENIYPAEVENVLMAHPDVGDVAVIGVPDDRWGETVKALVVPTPGSAVDASALIGWCRARLAHYKCPTSVERIEVVPRNPSGKVLKNVLRDPYWAGRERRVN